jgi:FkbM family methyltransferase
MTTSKRLASTLLRTAMRGNQEGLSLFGKLARRFADHVNFHANEMERIWRYNRPPSAPAPGWQIPTEGKVVYDFGANRGSNISYYLRQGFNVVAVEANPVLCKQLEQRFEADLRVQVVNACLVAEEAGESVPFFINNYMDKLSTFIRPTHDADHFMEINVRGRTPASLFAEFGEPFYVKIDLEGADGMILDALRLSGINPPYISAEAHSLDVLAKLSVAGYDQFKIVEGRYVHCPYFELKNDNERTGYQFEEGESAGPFGEDIPGIWVGADDVFAYIARHGTGWKDIHARRADMF